MHDTSLSTDRASANNDSIVNGSRNEDEVKMSIDEAMDAIGTGRFQNHILWAAGSCFMADSMEIMILSFLSPILQSEWNLTITQTATVTSVVFAGAMMGTLVLGPMSDKFGRMPIFILSGTIICIFGFGTAFTNEYVAFLLTRFMVGFGVGGLTVPFDTLAEFLPTETRGKYLIYIEYFWTLGSLGVTTFAFFTIEFGRSWRLFVLLCSIPCLVSVILGLIYVPESPRWLLSKGKHDKALHILRTAATTNGKDADLIFPHRNIKLHAEKDESTFRDLLRPRWRKLTLLLWFLWGAFAFTYYGTIMTVMRIFKKNNDYAFNYSAIFFSGFAEIVGTVVLVLLIDRIGRVRILVGSLVCGGIFVLLLCMTSMDNYPWVAIMFAFLARLSEMMLSCILWLCTAELLTTEIRTTGHSAANAVARIGGFISPYIVSDNSSLLLVGIFMLCVHLLGAYVASNLPETKGTHLGEVPIHDEHENENLHKKEIEVPIYEII